MRYGAVVPQGSFNADTWVKIYENELTSAATSVTISGLDGNTDIQYKLICRFVSNATLNTAITFTLNGDTGNNYGFQQLRGQSSTVSSARSTGRSNLVFNGTEGTELNQILFHSGILYAKSGYLRTYISENTNGISGTTIISSSLHGQVWNNTTDNITSIDISGSETNCLGIGTAIELWKPVPKV